MVELMLQFFYPTPRIMEFLICKPIKLGPRILLAFLRLLMASLSEEVSHPGFREEINKRTWSAAVPYFSNLSDNSQKFVSAFFLLTLAETFIFIYMGFDIAMEQHSWSHVGFIFFSILFIGIARATNVFSCLIW